jgi:hypothetical protein
MAIGSDCTHIFGLVVNPCSGSGPDGHSRTGSSSETRPVTASPANRLSRRRSDRSRHHPMSLAISHDGNTSFTLVHSGTRRSGLIGPSGGQQGPEDAGLLRRERHDGFIEATPRLERRDPAARRVGPPHEVPHDRARPMNEQRAEVDIPAFRDAPHALGAATGMLPWDRAGVNFVGRGVTNGGRTLSFPDTLNAAIGIRIAQSDWY